MREREEEPLSPAESEFGEALSRLKPTTPSLDPSRIRWEAQRRRARRDVWLWRGIAAALALALSLSLLFRPRAQTVGRLVYVPAPSESGRLVATIWNPAIPPEPLAIPAAAARQADDYLAVRSRVVAFGIRVLPAPAPTPSPATGHQATARTPTQMPARTLLDWFDPLPREGRS